MPNTIHCPSCSRELRVPDELIGKKVKCPACATTFTATVAGPEAAPPPPAMEEAKTDQPDLTRPPREQLLEEEYDRPMSSQAMARSRGLATLRPPAICLLVSGVLSLLVVGYFTLVALVLTRGQFEAQMRAQNPQQSDQEKEMANKMIGWFIGPGPAVVHVFFLVVNLVVILSSIMMLIGKMRWLAYLGCVLAILNIDCGCCLLGIPFGIWGLIALNSANGRAAFQ
jgi:predicted Zn finger-like uncharacterized protein